MNKKETAWKKNRRLGDIYGGRMRLRHDDNIFKRAHSLKAPNPGDELPILIEDNPSRDYFFPLSGSEVKEALFALPEIDYEGITHIWLRRIKKSDYEAANKPLAEFICGSGVRLIVLYPWAKTLVQEYGTKKPSQRLVKELTKYGAKLSNKAGAWVAQWELEGLRKYYIEVLLYHEVGHHIDRYYRHWSKANCKEIEEAANQYAFSKSSTATYVFDQLLQAAVDPE